MRYASLGRTGIEVSRFGLGSYLFPTGSGAGVHWRLTGKSARGDVTYDERRAIVERALELGVTLFDVDSDRAIELNGRIFHDLHCRERIVITAWSSYQPASEAEADRGKLEQSVERLLRLLRTDVIDVLAVHAPGSLAEGDYPAWLAEACAGIVEQGRVRCVAPYTSGGNHALGPYIETEGFGAVMVQLGLMNPIASTRGITARAAELDMGVLGAMPFQRGWVFRCAEEVGWGAGERAADVATAALRWCLVQPGVTAAVAGVSSLEEIEVNVRAGDQPYGKSDVALLRKLAGTQTYGEFIALAKEKSYPDIHDWREDLDALQT